MTRKKKLFLIAGCTFGGILLLIIIFNLWVVLSTNGRIYSNIEELPQRNVALVLGTSAYMAKGQENAFFTHRIEAAAKLYFSGKVKKLLVSGDNGTEYYNETEEMRKALLHKGIPEKDIVMDYAGFRTFYSVVRAKKVFGQDKLIIVSQRFHIQRALFIANSFGIDAVGYEAPDPVHNGSYFKVIFREIFARLAAVLDCYLLGTQPKYPGPPEPILFEKDSKGSSPEAR